MITSQNMSSETHVLLRIFLICKKVMFHSRDIQVFVVLTIPSRHDEYYYMRQGAFFNVSFESQLIKSPNLSNS